MLGDRQAEVDKCLEEVEKDIQVVEDNLDMEAVVILGFHIGVQLGKEDSFLHSH